MTIKSLLKLPLVGYDSEDAFLTDLDAMMDLAKRQLGFISAEIWKSRNDADEVVYLVESEWETREAMSTMEHHQEHDMAMARYSHKPIHLRLVPWVRP